MRSESSGSRNTLPALRPQMTSRCTPSEPQNYLFFRRVRSAPLLSWRDRELAQRVSCPGMGWTYLWIFPESERTIWVSLVGSPLDDNAANLLGRRPPQSSVGDTLSGRGVLESWACRK